MPRRLQQAEMNGTVVVTIKILVPQRIFQLEVHCKMKANGPFAGIEDLPANLIQRQVGETTNCLARVSLLRHDPTLRIMTHP
ncbi:hypothetical protein BGP82_05880 [Pseudomonas putida]|uniref:Uncharacterized protein n=1 Tax=Pseudomonas putida TaxID=303 RepID=A0A2S3XED4_PSEPU|nr:hypothetical protein BGP82_05880 [Pseudomonas putida]